MNLNVSDSKPKNLPLHQNRDEDVVFEEVSDTSPVQGMGSRAPAALEGLSCVDWVENRCRELVFSSAGLRLQLIYHFVMLVACLGFCSFVLSDHLSATIPWMLHGNCSACELSLRFQNCEFA